MGDQAGGDKEPTLELPKLFGRRRKKPVPPEQPADTAPEDAAPPMTPAPPSAPVRPQPATEPVRAPAPAAPVEPQSAPASSAEPVPPTRPRRRARPERIRPRVPGTLATLLTGLVVGAAGCALTYAALAGCEAVRGTSSCGGPGLFLLVAIVALMVLLGAGLLALMRVASPGSTSFLAVGLVVVLVMVALIDVVFSAWMFLVVPLMAAASYALSHWVTTRFAQEGADPAVFEDEPGPDVR